MIKSAPHIALLSAALTACAPAAEPKVEHQHNAPTADEITLGNGVANSIDYAGTIRNGPTLIIPQVIAAQDSFLVLYPFENGAAVQTDYVGAAFVPAGRNTNVAIRLDDAPDTGTPFIIMLHADVNNDRAFQFGDGVTVADAPVFEDSTLIAMPMKAPVEAAVTPALIRTSAIEHSAKAASFAERVPYRDDPLTARARTLIHRYLAIVEGENRTGEAARALFADEFLINFSSGPITTIEALDIWLNGPAASLAATRHVVQGVSIIPLNGGRYTLGMEMVWDGLTPAGGRMTAKTRHRWIVQEAGDALKIERIDVEILEPFAPAEWD